MLDRPPREVVGRSEDRIAALVSELAAAAQAGDLSRLREILGSMSEDERTAANALAEQRASSQRAQRCSIIVYIGSSPPLFVQSVGPFHNADDADDWCDREGIERLPAEGLWATVIPEPAGGDRCDARG